MGILPALRLADATFVVYGRSGNPDNGGLAVISLLLVFALAVQEVPERDGSSVHNVQLSTTVPDRCLSVSAGQGLSFVVDVSDVESMSAQAPGQWHTEAERAVLVRSQQARALLATPLGPKDSMGCERQEVLGDGAYALLHLVNQGRARVWDANAKAFLPYVERLEYNLDCSKGGFGKYTFRRPRGDNFFAIMACYRHGLNVMPKAWVPQEN